MMVSRFLVCWTRSVPWRVWGVCHFPSECLGAGRFKEKLTSYGNKVMNNYFIKRMTKL